MLSLMEERIRGRELGVKRRTEEEHLRAKPGLPIWEDRLVYCIYNASLLSQCAYARPIVQSNAALPITNILEICSRPEMSSTFLYLPISSEGANSQEVQADRMLSS